MQVYYQRLESACAVGFYLLFLAYKTVQYICTTRQLADFLCKGGKGPAADVIEKNLVLKAIRRLFANKKLLHNILSGYTRKMVDYSNITAYIT